MTLAYGAIGFYDDFLKVTKRSSAGFSGRIAARHSRLLIAAVAGYLSCMQARA